MESLGNHLFGVGSITGMSRAGISNGVHVSSTAVTGQAMELIKAKLTATDRVSVWHNAGLGAMDGVVLKHNSLARIHVVR